MPPAAARGRSAGRCEEAGERGEEVLPSRPPSLCHRRSLRPAYEGSALLEKVIGHLRSAGFLPITLTRGYADPGSHDVFQMDGLFARR
ncbi:MAG: hypothetical protein ABI131_12610 [Nostocoides sp.]